MRNSSQYFEDDRNGSYISGTSTLEMVHDSAENKRPKQNADTKRAKKKPTIDVRPDSANRLAATPSPVVETGRLRLTNANSSVLPAQRFANGNRNTTKSIDIEKQQQKQIDSLVGWPEPNGCRRLQAPTISPFRNSGCRCTAVESRC